MEESSCNCIGFEHMESDPAWQLGGREDTKQMMMLPESIWD